MTLPDGLYRHLTSPILFYFALGVFLALPLMMRWILGVTPFTTKLRLAQKFGLGTMCLLFACLPGMTFIDDQGNTASEWVGRILFGIMGLLMIGLGIRTIVRRQKSGEWEDFDNTPDS